MFVTTISVAMSRILGLCATVDSLQFFKSQCLGLESVTVISTTISRFSIT